MLGTIDARCKHEDEGETLLSRTVRTGETFGHENEWKP